MDDFVLDDCSASGTFLVASLDMRLDRLRSRRAFHRLECEARCDAPYHIPGRRPHKFRDLGLFMVHVQPWCHGLHLVRRSSKHRRQLCSCLPALDVAQCQ